MFSLQILEDFCLTTEDEVQAYTTEEKIDKPTLTGFDFAQLLDLIAGQTNKKTKTGKPTTFLLIVDSPGNSYWLAKSISDWSTSSVKILPVVEFPRIALSRINTLKGVEHILAEDEQDFSKLFCSFDCIALVCNNSTMLSWFDKIAKATKLKTGVLLVFDPAKALRKYSLGRYFMYSSIWTCG